MKRTQLLLALVAALIGCGLLGGAARADDRADFKAAWNHGDELFDLGKYSQAIQQYEIALSLAPKVRGENHPNTGDIVYNLANMHARLGHYAQAELLFQRSLKIFEAVHGKNHPYVADALNGLALLCKSQGKEAQVEPLLLRCLAILEAARGKNHPDVARTLNNLAAYYRDQGKLKQAEALFERSLKIYEAAHGQSHRIVALSLQNLGNLYSGVGQFSEAEPLLQRSLKIREAILVKDHPDVAQALGSLASMFKDQGKYADAEPLFRRSLEIREARLGKDHPDVAVSLNNLANSHLAQGQFAEAIPLLTGLRQGTRSFLLRELPSLSAREQQDYLAQTEATRFAVALSLGLRMCQDRAVAAQGAEWLLNGKAIGLEARMLNAQLEREADPALLQQLNDLRAQEAVLALKVAKPERRVELQAQRRDVEKSIAAAGGAGAKLAQPWVELASVRKAIPEGGLLIDITRFAPRRFGSKPGEKHWDAARYVAWVIPPAGDVAVVDLGAAEAIDAAVKAVRATVAKSTERIREVGEPKAAAEMADPLQKLADLVLKPLMPHLGQAKSLILSPDGELWLAPWAALPVAGGRFLVEDYALRYVITGRDLVAVPPAKRLATSAPLVLADPRFDDGAGDDAPPAAEDAGRGSLARLPQVRRLPGTAGEAEAVLPRLEALTGSAATVHTDEKATEAAVKSAMRPKVLVLATHGFFLPTQEVVVPDERLGGEGKRSAPSLTKDGQPVENPLLRCGLLLAGCNRRGALQPGEDDGVLTGLEIVGTDLRGTEMVVLSACVTGLGDVKTGEGVAGLRQAFQLAGAESVVATLWQIPDAPSAQLMVGFFDGLAQKLPRDEALRAAQLGQVEARRKRFGAAHPFFWAAYTVTGQVK